MKVTALLEARGRAMQQELPIVIEPALGLEKREKEAARRAQQGEFALFGGRGGRCPGCGGGGPGAGCGGRERLDRLLERAIESGGECIAPQDVGEPRVTQRRVLLGHGGQ